MADIIYTYNNQVYFNLTNHCPCRCEFCIRSNRDSVGESSTLWFEQEPTMEEITEAMENFDFTGYQEVVFCGYGEPTVVLDKMALVSQYVRSHYGLRVRLNTNGLGDLIHKRSIAAELSELVDSVSISLNMPDAEQYDAIVHPSFGKKSFEAMLKFAADCKKVIPDVRFSVVNVIGEKNIAESQKLADAMGIPLRVRVYDDGTN